MPPIHFDFPAFAGAKKNQERKDSSNACNRHGDLFAGTNGGGRGTSWETACPCTAPADWSSFYVGAAAGYASGNLGTVKAGTTGTDNLRGMVTASNGIKGPAAGLGAVSHTAAMFPAASSAFRSSRAMWCSVSKPILVRVAFPDHRTAEVSCYQFQGDPSPRSGCCDGITTSRRGHRTAWGESRSEQSHQAQRESVAHRIVRQYPIGAPPGVRPYRRP